ncbi:MAG: hypothetical protein E6Y11_01825 [Corynebacterium sp.]|nr:hypothetical protein [Corynebacterium sp.]
MDSPDSQETSTNTTDQQPSKPSDSAPKKKALVITAAVVLVALVATAVFWWQRSESQESEAGAPADTSAGAASDVDRKPTSFLVRDGKFDCTTMDETIPISVRQQIPGTLGKAQGQRQLAVERRADGTTVCPMTFVATGDVGGIDDASTEAATSTHDMLLYLELPMDYRSFVIESSSTCAPPEAEQTPESIDSLTPRPDQKWEVLNLAPDEAGIAAVAARLSDSQLGCLTAKVLFPEGTISPDQMKSSRDLLAKFVDAAAEPLSTSIAAAKGPGKQASRNQNLAIERSTFVTNHGLDCRQYVLNSSLTHQHETGLVSDFHRIPGDYNSSPEIGDDTPLFKVASDKQSVTCWFNSNLGGMNTFSPVEFETYGSVPVTVTTTSANSKLRLPNSMSLKDVSPDSGDALADWHYFVYIPGESAPVSGSEENPQTTLELEKAETPTLNVYRCRSNGNDTSDGKDTENGTEGASNESSACLIMSIPTNYLTPFDIATFYLDNPLEEQDPEDVRQDGPDPEALAKEQRFYAKLNSNSLSNNTISNLIQLAERVDPLLAAN